MAVRRTFRPPQHEFSGRWLSELQRGQVTSCVSWLPALAPALAAKIHAACRRYFWKGFCCRWLGCRVGNKVFGVKLLSRSIAGRIVLSHARAFTMRRTRSLPKTWQCDELSARRSMNFLADGSASCSVARSHHVYRGSLP